MIESINKINERKKYRWENFVSDNLRFNFNKEELEYVKFMVDKGFTCQKNLEKDSSLFSSYTEYIKSMLLNISIQDSIINDLLDFKKEVIKYRDNKKVKTDKRYACNKIRY